MNVNNIGRVLVSLVVVMGFMVTTYMFLTAKASGVSPGETLTLLVGALASNFTSVVSYWIGSSSGSTAKDEQLSKAADNAVTTATATAATAATAASAASAAVDAVKAATVATAPVTNGDPTVTTTVTEGDPPTTTTTVKPA